MNTKQQLAGKRIVIAVGSGFIGLSMAAAFGESGAAVTIVSRSKPKTALEQSKLPDQRGVVVRTDPEMVLYGRCVLPKRLMDEGFEFQFAELEPALKDLHEGKN